MISMSYFCTKCGYKTAILDDAQDHTNETTHHMGINGFITPNKITIDKEAIRASAQASRARDTAILRLAKEKGLVP